MTRLFALGAPIALITMIAARPAPPVLTVARLQYDGGGDWYANPSSLPNLLAAIRQRTSLQVDKVEAKVTLMDDKLWDYPFIHVTGHGNIKFSDAEVLRLREYLQRGGFLHVDDNYGLDSSFRRESNSSRTGADNDEIVHPLIISGFWIQDSVQSAQSISWGGQAKSRRAAW